MVRYIGNLYQQVLDKSWMVLELQTCKCFTRITLWKRLLGSVITCSKSFSVGCFSQKNARDRDHGDKVRPLQFLYEKWGSVSLGRRRKGHAHNFFCKMGGDFWFGRRRQGPKWLNLSAGSCHCRSEREEAQLVEDVLHELIVRERG